MAISCFNWGLAYKSLVFIRDSVWTLSILNYKRQYKKDTDRFIGFIFLSSLEFRELRLNLDSGLLDVRIIQIDINNLFRTWGLKNGHRANRFVI